MDRLLGLPNGLSHTAHSRARRRDRQFDDFDVRRVLEHGVPSVDEWDERYRNWKYKFSGVDMDGDALTIVVVIEETLGIIRIITGYG